MTDQWSDIDVAVISPQISDDRFELLPFNPTNFAEDDPLVREIINKGLVESILSLRISKSDNTRPDPSAVCSSVVLLRKSLGLFV